MNRTLSLLLGPEIAMAVFTAAVFLFCARYHSGNSRDLALLERAMWWLAVIAAPLAFATICVPGAKSWWWLGRVNLAVSVALLVCSIKIVNTYGPTGSGRTGAGFGIMVVFGVGIVVGALANAAAGALILAEAKPTFAQWFHAHRFVAGLLTSLAAFPIGVAMTFVIGVLVSVVFAIATLFNR